MFWVEFQCSAIAAAAEYIPLSAAAEAAAAAVAAVREREEIGGIVT